MSLFSSAGERLVAAPVLSLPAKILTKVAYGNDSLQSMDVYLPAGRSVATTKFMVLIHGGGWASGDKAEFATAIDLLQKRLPHYAIFNINYRLATQTAHHFPAQEEDVPSAIAHIINQKQAYGVSDKFVLLGASAGGHLALLQGYKNKHTFSPEAVISFFGPVDMAEMYNRQTNAYYQYGLQLLVGGIPSSNPASYYASSPINFVTDQSVPTLIFHGGNDRLVPVQQSKSLKKKLDAHDVPAELVVYPSEGHGWYGSLLASSFEKVDRFLDRHVK